MNRDMQSTDELNNLEYKKAIQRIDMGKDYTVMFVEQLHTGNVALWFAKFYVEVRSGDQTQLKQILRWNIVDGAVHWLDEGHRNLGGDTWELASEDVQSKYRAWLAKEMLK